MKFIYVIEVRYSILLIKMKYVDGKLFCKVQQEYLDARLDFMDGLYFEYILI